MEITLLFSPKSLNLEALNPIQDGPLRGCSRMGGGKKASLPKICHYPTIMKYSYTLPKEDQEIYEAHDTPLDISMSSADISIFLLEISRFCYVKKCRYRLHFYT